MEDGAGKMELVARKTNHGIRGLKVSNPHPHLLGREKDWSMN